MGRIGGRRLAVGSTFVAAVAIAVSVAWPTAAWADPAVPTHYRSTIVGLVVADPTTDPAEPVGQLEGIDIEILGGDAFFVVRSEGRRVEVPGYEGEPYLRIHVDGRVEVNERSPARWLNDARYGGRDVVVPPSADAAAPPMWRTVGERGEIAWHDHRIHFMAPGVPRQIDATRDEVQHVFDWQVPIVVDGSPLVVIGRLEWVPGPGGRSHAAIAAWMLVVVAAATRLARRREAGALLAVAATVALAVGIGGGWGLPAGAEGDTAGVLLPVVAACLLAGAWVLERRGLPRAKARLAAWTAAAPLAAWVGLQATSLTRPIVPSVWPAGVVRASVAAVAALIVAALIAARHDSPRGHAAGDAAGPGR
jgi:hypothetical protein